MEGAVRGETSQNHRITVRGMLHAGSAALAGVSALAVAKPRTAESLQGEISANHNLERIARSSRKE